MQKIQHNIYTFFSGSNFGLLIIMVVLTCPSLFSQSTFKSEEEMIKAANEMFESKRFAEAMPLYSQLVSLYPKDISYNMKYGACLLHADPDKSAGLKYLKYAVSNTESPAEGNYYYALGLHYNYDFDKAIKYYQKFKELGNKKEVDKLMIDRQIEMCNNGKTLVSNVYDLNVIEKKEMSMSEFFRVYNLGEIGGKIIVKPDEFKSKSDLKSTDLSLIHLPPEASVIYFSGYGENTANGKDIFRVRKTGTDWSAPENVGNVVNTKYDEDFPFMHPDGTLYFASKGHNSMGGYDLFKSEYNESSGSWSQPENLNFAISSAFDDVLFITDFKKQLAYFASGRATTDNKYNVYRVQISRKPFEQAFLAGNFISEGETKVESAKITIYDIENNEKVGTFYTDKESGKYNINLPKGGKSYKFVVETDENAPVHTGKVDVPVQEGMVSLKQEIRLVGSGEDQKLVIKNLFNETTPVADESKLALLRSTSDLEVNTTEAEVLQDLVVQSNETSEVISPSTASLDEKHANLIIEMESVQSQAGKDLISLKDQIAFGFKYAFDRALAADKLYDLVDVSRQKMLNENDPAEKQKLYDELMAQKNKLDPVASDAIVSYDFTKSLANEYDEKINDIERLKSDLSELKSGGSVKSAEEKQADLDIYGPMVTDMKSMRSAFEIAPQRYKDLLEKTKVRLNKEELHFNDLKQDIESVRLEISTLEKRISEAKNNKTKEQLSSEKGSKEIDLQDLEYEFASAGKNYRLLQQEESNLESDALQMEAFIQKIKSNKSPVSQLNNEDQDELNKLIEFLKEQRLIDDVIGPEAETMATSAKNQNDNAVAKQYSPIDNSGNPVEYDELYLVNLAGIELISDEEKRYAETSALYRNWSATVKEDREIQENHLAYTKSNSEKDIITERIKILTTKEAEYSARGEEFRKKAEMAAQPEITANNLNENQSSEVEKGQKKPDKGTSVSGDKATGGKKVTGTAVLLAGADKTIPENEKSSLESINKNYEKAVNEIQTGTDDPVASITLAAFELSWAKSIDKLIQQKESELESTKNEAEWAEIQKVINQYKTERDKHIAAASGEFTAMEIATFTGELPSETESEYYIPFDPEKQGETDYDKLYQDLVTAVTNHQILSADEKNRELSMIHNYWSKTIQDEILWQNEEKTKLKSQAELQEIKNKILDLTGDKKKHISLSNEFYQKYKESQLFSADVVVAEKKREQETVSSLDPAELKAEATSFGEYAKVYAIYNSDREVEMEKIENNLKSAGSKSEKQQLSLSLAMMKRQNSDESIAIEELKGNGDKNLISEEANNEITSDVSNWQQEAENYVFAKKDFALEQPENGDAYESYKNARQSYNEVVYLEKQKEGLLASAVVNKKAEEELLATQDKIDAKKVEVYKALAEAGTTQFNANKREIDALVLSNPGLEKSNPKLWNDIIAAEVIFKESEKYRENAEGFKSNSLKFDIYDQAQFMTEYVLNEQKSIISALKGAAYTGELAFLVASGNENPGLNQQVESFKINRTEMEALMIDPVYMEYEKDRKAIEEIRKERISIEARVVNEESVLKTLIAERNAIVQEAAGQKKGKRKKLMKEAEVLDQKIAEQQKILDEVTLQMVQLKEKENNINNNSARLLKSADVDDRYKMVLLAEKRIRGIDETAYISEAAVDTEVLTDTPDVMQNTEGGTTTAVVGSDEFKNMDTQIPKELNGDLFITAATANVSPYSASKPIPVDVEMPKGVIFKVQVGAFRNPIPQDLFKGFAPLMGEKLNNGITRYTAGLFRDFNNANLAKNEIRKLGYDDAFVVAFVDGKRISFQELRNVENIDLPAPAVITDRTYNGVPPEVLTTASKIDDAGEVSSAIAEQTTNALEVKGIFFTVQVGVYTNTLLPDKLKTLKELNSELLPNGNIRYTAGQFNTSEEARSRMSDIRQVVNDAFITAYADGKRVSTAEAVRLLTENAR